MNQKEFGKKVKLYAVEKYGSMKAYAESIGVTPTYVSRICRGEISPNKKILGDLGYKKITKVEYEK